MIGRKAERILGRAAQYAMDHQHEYFTLETVLLEMLSDSVIADAIRACGGNIDQLKAELEAYLSKETPRVNLAESRAERHPVATHAVQRLIQRALFHVQSAGKNEIEPEDLFVALFQAKEAYALYLLQKQGIHRLDVVQYLSHGVKHDEESQAADASNSDVDDEEDEASESGGTGRSRVIADPLEQYAVNLNEQASQGKIDPLVGRAHELERVIQTLCRRRKNNPLLVGEAGVGKTALAEGLALRIVSKEVPEILENAVVYSLDLGSLVAGTKFRGDFEQRVKKVLQSLKKLKEKGKNPILFVDEIHSIIGAGSVSGGALDAANLIKPPLTRGELQCIGSTTFKEYRTIFEKDHALARRFQKIDVVEPTIEEAIQILNGLKSKFEEFHRVEYAPEAIRAAVELSAKYITDRFLPDKAVDLMDEVGARARLAQGGKVSGDIVRVGVEQVEAVVSQVARIPAKSVTTNQKVKLKSIDRDLKMLIYGQDHAIEAVTTAIRLARSGLRSGEKPIGNFLFSGPTGVGKTELTKQLANALGVPFLRFDMSEYMEKHAVSRLIGAPPGYVGFDQSGMLTDAVLKNPHSVILLDEIEKAHPDLMNILLQVMDYGFLTDNNGRKADFRNTVLVMTSNVGSRDLEKRSLGLVASGSDSSARAQKAVEQYFTPEFRNRLDAIIYFNPIDPSTMDQVVHKQLAELESQLLAKGVELELTPAARKWLAEKGYERSMGARPLARVIQEYLKKPLSEQLLFGELENGGNAWVDLESGALTFKFRKRKAKLTSEEDEVSVKT